MTQELIDYLSSPEELRIHADNPEPDGRNHITPDVLYACADKIDQLKKEIARLRDERRWIPVNERLPEYMERVLFYGGGEMTVHIGYYVPELPQWTAEDGGFYHGKNISLITHWMPLLTPPEEER